MNWDPSWEIDFENELERAETARESGNEGRARVCARRAAGIVIGEYLARKGLPSPGPSAIDRLHNLVELEELPEDLREIASHFLLRINENWTLPVQVDLIAEARWLAGQLLV